MFCKYNDDLQKNLQSVMFPLEVWCFALLVAFANMSKLPSRPHQAHQVGQLGWVGGDYGSILHNTTLTKWVYICISRGRPTLNQTKTLK